MSLISGVPVRAISRGRGARARMRSESSSTCCERWEVLFLMKCASSTTMPRNPKAAEPADVPVEHLVVDDDDVGEAVDRVTVAVDHGGAELRCPQAGLTGPVGLDDVRHDDQQRVGVRCLRGEQCLSGLAQAGLVGEQEGPVAGLGRRDDLGLVRHQVEARRDVRVARHRDATRRRRQWTPRTRAATGGSAPSRRAAAAGAGLWGPPSSPARGTGWRGCGRPPTAERPDAARWRARSRTVTPEAPARRRDRP